MEMPLTTKRPAGADDTDRAANKGSCPDVHDEWYHGPHDHYEVRHALARDD